MAKPKQTDKPPVGARSFKKTGEGFYTLEAGDEVRGKFVRMRTLWITDRETHERKQIRAYDLMVDGKQISISGRALLNDAFDDVFAEVTHDGLRGKDISIVRGEDVESAMTEATGNMMGTYEILLWD